MRKAKRSLALAAVLLAASVFGTSDAMHRAEADDAPRLPSRAVRIIESLDGLEASPTELDQSAPCCTVDGAAPAVLLPQTLDGLRALRRGWDGPGRARVTAATRSLDAAWSAFSSPSRPQRGDASDISYLVSTAAWLQKSAEALEKAEAVAPAQVAVLEELQASLSAAAARMANDVVQVAERAGVSQRRLLPATRRLQRAERLRASGDHAGAIERFKTVIGLGGGTIEFDLDAFVQNIRDTFDDETIGYTYAVSLFDSVYDSDGIGEARIAPDGNLASQDAGKEMHVASVSKTLTAAIVLWLLEANGLDPDDPIGPWLPPDWPRGNGVDAQTFRDFLTHRTGFTQKGVSPDTVPTYANLQAAVAIDVPGNTSHMYNNSNFALFRVIVPRLAGFDLEAFPEYDDDELTAGLFVFTALSFYEAVDAHITCNAGQPIKTLYYSFPHNGTNGLQTPDDFSLECGAYGFYVQSEELGEILAGLVATDELLSDAAWDEMRSGSLGFFNPADGYFWGNGDLGLYHNHGGDWDSGIKGMDACVMVFPNGISAALAINSIGGDYPYQCEALRAAFDGAWVPS